MYGPALRWLCFRLWCPLPGLQVMPDATNLAELHAHLAELRAGSQTKTALLGGVTMGAVPAVAAGGEEGAQSFHTGTTFQRVNQSG